MVHLSRTVASARCVATIMPGTARGVGADAGMILPGGAEQVVRCPVDPLPGFHQDHLLSIMIILEWHKHPRWLGPRFRSRAGGTG